METFESFKSQLYTVNEGSFENIALQLFRFQAVENPIYKEYLTYLRIDPSAIRSLTEIPYMPISFFKTNTVKTGAWQPEVVFKSSGTTGVTTSRHEIRNLSFYLEHAQKCFEHFFGPVENYHFFAFLPSYLERGDSSLIAMMQHFIKTSNSKVSGFYLTNHEQLLDDIQKQEHNIRKTILWGVGYALLDLAERKPDLKHCLVFETGGMKGRRKEMTKGELHYTLQTAFNVDQIYSEYGMTELLSQAYSQGGDKFKPSPWMRIIGRDIADPFNKGLLNETAGINVVDLANWHSVAFIETEDLGKISEDGSFEVVGRLDNSDIRGCNLLVE